MLSSLSSSTCCAQLAVLNSPCRSDPKEAERVKLAQLIKEFAKSYGANARTAAGAPQPKIYVLDAQV